MNSCIAEQVQTEAGCRKLLREAHFPEGNYECPNCRAEMRELKTRGTFQCVNRECRKQLSLTAGTLFHGLQIPLSKPFKILLQILSGEPKSVSALADELEMHKSTTWRWYQKIRIAIENNLPLEQFKIDRKLIESVLFRRSVESPPRIDGRVVLEDAHPEPTSVFHLDFNYSPRSDRERFAITSVLKFISRTYHGVSEKYSQLYCTESFIASRNRQSSFKSFLSVMVRAGPIKCNEIQTYSSPKLVAIPFIE